MIELHSLEAEHGVIGAMLKQPHLISVISDELSPDAFAYQINAELYRLILDLDSAGTPVDIITLAEAREFLTDETRTIAYAGEIMNNTPSVANAKTYARIVRERAVSRQIADAASGIEQIAREECAIEDKIAQAQALVLSLDAGGADGECQMIGDILRDHIEVLQERHDRAQNGDTMDGLSSGIPDLDKYTQGLKPGQMVVIAGRPAMGKAQPLTSQVLRADGTFTVMGEIRVGEQLASVDGAHSEVVGVYPQGIRPIYRVTLTDGRTVEADAEHLWAISSSKFDDRTVTTLELQRLLTRKRYRGRITLAVHAGRFGSDPGLGMDPWLLGFLLGDGSLTSSTVRFATPESYILERVEGASGVAPKHVAAYDYTISTPRGQDNPLLIALRSLGVMGKASHEKVVPSRVFTADRDVRRDVLAGLLESDGWVEKTGSVVFASSSRQLRDDVVALVESLGGSCCVTQKSGCGYKRDGKHVPCRDSHLVYVKLADLDQFIRSPRLLKNMRPRYYTDQPYVTAVEYVRDDEALCIKVSHPSELYLTDRWVVTHNTTLAMNVAADVAIKQSRPVLVISLEMTKTQLIDRLIAAVGGIPLPNLKDGSCTHKDSTELAAATFKLRDAKIAVTDVPVMTMPRIRSIARRQKHRMGDLGLIVIDYLGLVEGDGKGRVDDVTTMSRQVKLLAREMGCPVAILCQLNRGCESRPDKRPVLSDLRESGAIEQDADIVMFVYRDEVYYPSSDQKGIGEILIRKNRDGEIGSVFTAFQGDKSRFVPLAPRSQAQRQGEDW